MLCVCDPFCENAQFRPKSILINRAYGVKIHSSTQPQGLASDIRPYWGLPTPRRHQSSWGEVRWGVRGGFCHLRTARENLSVGGTSLTSAKGSAFDGVDGLDQSSIRLLRSSPWQRHKGNKGCG